GRPGGGVLHVADPPAVPGEEHRAGAFEPLLGEDRLIGRKLEFGLYRPVRPDDARDIDLRVLAETEVEMRRCDHLFLGEQAGADLDLAADAEGVDALIAGRFGGARANGLIVIVLRPAIDQLNRFGAFRTCAL